MTYAAEVVIPRYNPAVGDIRNGAVRNITISDILTVLVLNHNPRRNAIYSMLQNNMIGVPSPVRAFGISAVMFGNAKWDDVMRRSGSPYEGTGIGVTVGIATVFSAPHPVASQAL